VVWVAQQRRLQAIPIFSHGFRPIAVIGSAVRSRRCCNRIGSAVVIDHGAPLDYPALALRELASSSPEANRSVVALCGILTAKLPGGSIAAMSEPVTYHAMQRTATRESILLAVERCLAERGLDELTFSQVAQEAGVGERTVYRHFATKDDLLEAVWRRVQQVLGMEHSTRSWRDYLETRPQAFTVMEAHRPLLQAVLRSAQAQHARRRVSELRRTGIRKVVAEAAGELPEPAMTEICALVHLLGSAPAWSALREYWGIEGERAGEVVARAIAIVVANARAFQKGNAK
jgi:AcrR family transcriptional regulator